MGRTRHERARAAHRGPFTKIRIRPYRPWRRGDRVAWEFIRHDCFRAHAYGFELSVRDAFHRGEGGRWEGAVFTREPRGCWVSSVTYDSPAKAKRVATQAARKLATTWLAAGGTARSRRANRAAAVAAERMRSRADWPG